MNGLRSGQLAKTANVNGETLRYYERRGLLPDPPRRKSGYRVYPVESVSRVRFIKGAQDLGFTLEEIEELLAMRIDKKASKTEVRERAQNKVTQIDAKITALQQMRNALSHLIDQCHGDGPTSECPILEAIELHTYEKLAS